MSFNRDRDPRLEQTLPLTKQSRLHIQGPLTKPASILLTKHGKDKNSRWKPRSRTPSLGTPASSVSFDSEIIIGNTQQTGILAHRRFRKLSALRRPPPLPCTTSKHGFTAVTNVGRHKTSVESVDWSVAMNIDVNEERDSLQSVLHTGAIVPRLSKMKSSYMGATAPTNDISNILLNKHDRFTLAAVKSLNKKNGDYVPYSTKVNQCFYAPKVGHDAIVTPKSIRGHVSKEKYRGRCVPNELTTYPAFPTIVTFFVQEEVMKKPPIPGLVNSWARELYLACISRDRRVKKILLQNRRIMPVDQKQEIEHYMETKLTAAEIKAVASSGAAGEMTKSTAGGHGKDDLTEEDKFFFSSLKGQHDQLLKQAEYDFPALGYFYVPLFNTRFETFNKTGAMELQQGITFEASFAQLEHHYKQLQMWSHNCLLDVISDVATLCYKASQNSIVAERLCTADWDWYEAIVHCLASPHESVRQDASCLVAYVATLPRLMQQVYMVYNMEYLITFILRCLNENPSSLPFYVAMLTYLFQYYPHMDLLISLTQHIHRLKEDTFKSKWPLFACYAFRFWPLRLFREHRFFLRNLVVQLEKCHCKSISRAHARRALMELSRKLGMKSLLVATVGLNTMTN